MPGNYPQIQMKGKGKKEWLDENGIIWINFFLTPQMDLHVGIVAMPPIASPDAGCITAPI